MGTEKQTKKAPVKAAAKAAAPAPIAVKAVAGTGGRRELTGTVVSDKMEKTIVVRVERQVRHHLYKKYLSRLRRFKAHDEQGTAKVGDLVRIVESRPLSRDKRWALKEIVRRAAQTIEINV